MPLNNFAQFFESSPTNMTTLSKTTGRQKGNGYLTCCCLEADINDRCLYTLGNSCFAASTAPNCCLYLMKETKEHITKLFLFPFIFINSKLSTHKNNSPEKKHFWEQKLHESESYPKLETVKSMQGTWSLDFWHSKQNLKEKKSHPVMNSENWHPSLRLINHLKLL